ncbi:Protein of unknown function DUF1365 [Ceraceosorus bombacis]|uniref:Uncharacterized protein n=1 Tax=Ceraceosorus bombacis TaxID=401625 RepID=A0A0P1BNW1_9BASI|nr:Protein of unknown function DUF1365 [Ceraceosorus bombacis]
MSTNVTQAWRGAGMPLATPASCWEEFGRCSIIFTLRALDIAVPTLFFLLWLKYAWNALKSKAAAADASSTAHAQRSPQSQHQQHKAWVSSCKVRHARFIPTTHAFAYPALYGIYELSALESGQCDAQGAFRWQGHGEEARVREGGKSGIGWLPCITAIHPRSHLHLAIPSLSTSTRSRVEGSILRKLAWELRERGHTDKGPQDEASLRDEWRSQLGQVWMVCMPSLAGLQGINPLTTYFVHRPTSSESERGPLWLCVLEVHNTFSERHLYILEVGKGEDALPTSATKHRGSYEHSWTFDRAFHVSPFNDRGGWYRLLLSPLWKEGQQHPEIDVRLVLLVASKDEGGRPIGELVAKPHADDAFRRKKLFATLNSTQVRPLTTSTMWWALIRQPFDLILPFGRILAEAAKLHFQKRLSVFPKPEVRAPLAHHQEPSSSKVLSNDVQARRGSAAADLVRGAIGWQAETGAEKTARERLAAFARTRADENGPGLKIVSADPLAEKFEIATAPEHADVPTMVITTRSQAVYSDLLLFPPRFAHLVGSVAGQRWDAPADALQSYLMPFVEHSAQKMGWRTRCARFIRRKHLAWLLTFCDLPSEGPRSASTLLNMVHAPHPLDQLSTPDGSFDEPSLNHLFALLSTASSARLEEFLVRRSGVHYVSGTEGWLELRRALAQLDSPSDSSIKASWDWRLGSVLAS